MSLNDLIKKTKFKIDLSKYKLSNSEIDEVYNLYNYVIAIFFNNFSEELKKNKDISKNRINNRIIEDIVKIVKLKKSFIINDITMDYIINKKNSFTILQFLNNFHYLSQDPSENNIFNYNLSVFIKYIMNRSYEDSHFLERILLNESLSKITKDYLNSIVEFKKVSDADQAIDMFNYLVGIIWYNELVYKYPDIVQDISLYIVNNFDEINEQIKLDDSVSETSYDDNCTDIISSYINKKVKKLL